MSTSLSQKFREQLTRSGVIPVGSKVLVALSGGADSVALLHLLHDLGEQHPLQVVAAHLDHGLRPDSGADAEFVRRLCAELAVPLALERIDVSAEARERRCGVEEVARDVRRAFLLRTAEEVSADLIALGHHRDDQAETVLMRLLRGAGPTGLVGMRQSSPPFVRPLLEYSRSDLRGYLREAGLAWREDLSNQDIRFTRNRLRHELLPALQDYNPNLPTRLAELSEVLAREEDYWAGQVVRALASVLSEQDGEVFLDCAELQRLHPALAARVVRAALARVRGDLKRIAHVHIQDILSLACSETTQAELCLPDGWVGRRYQRLWLRQGSPGVPEPLEMEIGAPGDVDLPGGGLLQVRWQACPLGEDRWSVEFDGTRVRWPLTLRSWQPGDRMQPSGMAGRKKLQDLFVDAKLTREERAAQLLLTSADEVLWVLGFRRSELWRPPAGGKILRLSVRM